MAFGPTGVEGPCYEDGPEIFVSYPKDTTHVCGICMAGRPSYSASTGTSAPDPGKQPDGSGVCTSASRAGSGKGSGYSSSAGSKAAGTRASHLSPNRLLPRLRSWGPRCTVHPFTLRTACSAPHSSLGAHTPLFGAPQARQLELHGTGPTSLSPLAVQLAVVYHRGGRGQGLLLGKGKGTRAVYLRGPLVGIQGCYQRREVGG